MASVIGVSGSPLPDSNTDQAVRAVCGATGLDHRFFKLSEFDVAPCRACLGCLETNRCVIDDDGRMLAEEVRGARAVVVGGFTPYSTLDARTKAFLERLYPLRHRHGLLRGKAIAAVITTAVPPGAEGLPPAGDMGVSAVQFLAMEEGMSFVGALVQRGNVPCVKCGMGDECDMSALKMLYGPDATVANTPIHCFALSNTALAEAEALGRRIRQALG